MKHVSTVTCTYILQDNVSLSSDSFNSDESQVSLSPTLKKRSLSCVERPELPSQILTKPRSMSAPVHPQDVTINVEPSLNDSGNSASFKLLVKNTGPYPAMYKNIFISQKYNSYCCVY